MWFKLVAVLLVTTPGVLSLNADEAAQFTGDGCTPADGFTGGETSATVNDDGSITITSNHIPNHEWEEVNRNSPAEHSKSYTFTTPNMLPDGQEKCLPQGPIGIAKNGVYIYNPTTATGGNAKTLETMDCNGGHSDNRGAYHYHSLPDNKVIYDNDDPSSQFIGVAFDGVPIYSIGDGINAEDLDICHGMSVDGEYRYIASEDHFPYFLGCYKASPQFGNAGNRDCSGMSPGEACTCQLGIIRYSKKRALLELLEEVLSDKRSNPKYSWISKRVSCGGTCGVTQTSGAGGPGAGGPGAGGPGAGGPGAGGPGAGGPGQGGPRPGGPRPGGPRPGGPRPGGRGPRTSRFRKTNNDLEAVKDLINILIARSEEPAKK